MGSEISLKFCIIFVSVFIKRTLFWYKDRYKSFYKIFTSKKATFHQRYAMLRCCGLVWYPPSYALVHIAYHWWQRVYLSYVFSIDRCMLWMRAINAFCRCVVWLWLRTLAPAQRRLDAATAPKCLSNYIAVAHLHSTSYKPRYIVMYVTIYTDAKLSITENGHTVLYLNIHIFVAYLW